MKKEICVLKHCVDFCSREILASEICLSFLTTSENTSEVESYSSRSLVGERKTPDFLSSDREMIFPSRVRLFLFGVICPGVMVNYVNYRGRFTNDSSGYITDKLMGFDKGHWNPPTSHVWSYIELHLFKVKKPEIQGFILEWRFHNRCVMTGTVNFYHLRLNYFYFTDFFIYFNNKPFIIISLYRNNRGCARTAESSFRNI